MDIAVIVTHSMAQARRVSNERIFMLLGEMMEQEHTKELFPHPKTAEDIEVRYG